MKQQPKLSVVIPYYAATPDKKTILDRCINSIKGQYDELIIVAQPPGAGIGFVPAINMGYSLTHGDFMIMCSDDVILTSGSLRDLCDPSTVASAQIKGRNIQDFWGTLWCTPRWIYNKIGPIDENYKNGIFYDDNEYYEQIIQVCKPYTNINVIIDHPHGGETLEHTANRDVKIQNNHLYFLNKYHHEPYVLDTNTVAKYHL